MRGSVVEFIGEKVQVREGDSLKKSFAKGLVSGAADSCMIFGSVVALIGVIDIGYKLVTRNNSEE